MGLILWQIFYFYSIIEVGLEAKNLFFQSMPCGLAPRQFAKILELCKT